VGIGRTTFKVWLASSIVWIVAIGIMVYVGGIFSTGYQTDFPLRADLEPWQSGWKTSDPLRKPLYEIIRSPSAEHLPLKFQSRFYQGAIWNQHIHSRELPSFNFPSGETLDLPADLTEADRDYIRKAFWDQRWPRWKETLGPYAQAAILLPLAAFVILWVVRFLRVKISGKEPAPEAPRLPYSPAMERLRNITLAASGIEILLWLVLGALNQMEDPQTLVDALSVMFVIMLPSLAAFLMSLLRRGPLTAAVLAAFAVTLLLPQLVPHIVPQSWLPE
jgi:hypothetical protein